MRILLSGGAGFIGSNLALQLKQKYPAYTVQVVDNLVRRGSELNIPTLQKAGVFFQHADIRIAEDLAGLPAADLIIDASADPSILSGIESATVRSLQTNLWG